MPTIYSHYITGSYLGHSGGLSSGIVHDGDLTNYERAIRPLFEVLDAAAPTGNPYWGNQGVRISQWNHGGRTIVSREEPSVEFKTREQIEAFLCLHGITN